MFLFMKKILNLLILTFALQTISSCAYLENFAGQRNKAVPQIDYLSNGAKLNLKTFFNGELEAFAIVKDANDQIQSTYTTKMNGSWDENQGSVRHNSVYNNGKKDNRTWLITLSDNGEYHVIGHDFVKEADGKQMGNSSLLNYSLKQNYQDKKQEIDFEDRLYLVNENSAIVISIARQGKTVISKSIISIKKN